MITAIELLEKTGSPQMVRVATEFEAVTDFQVPINYYDEAGFHFYAANPRNAVEMFDFTDF